MQDRSQGHTQWDPERLKLRSRNRLKIELTGYTGTLHVEIPFYVLVGNRREPRMLILAGVHGDEYEGIAALQELAREVDPKKLMGTLTLVPVVNPQAFYAGTRRNPVDLGDLNRSFPGNPDGTLSERLAHTLFQELVLGNDCLLSMHGWSKECQVVTYVEYPIGKSTACRKSYAAARALGQEYLHPYAWPRGVLGEAAIKYGIACIEPEVGGNGTVTREGQRTYREMVYRLLSHWKMTDLETDLSRPASNPKIIGHSDIFANHSGLFRCHASIGDRVKKEELLGKIYGLGGERLEAVRAPRAGVVGVLRTFASVQPGDRLVQIFYERGKAK